jgi:hypothetical protein
LVIVHQLVEAETAGKAELLARLAKLQLRRGMIANSINGEYIKSSCAWRYNYHCSTIFHCAHVK